MSVLFDTILITMFRRYRDIDMVIHHISISTLYRYRDIITFHRLNLFTKIKNLCRAYITP